MNQPGRFSTCFLIILSSILLTAGCDPVARSATADGNSFTDKEDHLKRAFVAAAVTRWGDHGELAGRGHILAGDFNGDGRQDIVIHYNQIDVVQIHIMGEYGFYHLEALPMPQSGAIAVGDVDGDQRHDLVIVDALGEESTSYKIEDAPSQVGAQMRAVAMATNPLKCFRHGPIGIADTNGDGRGDLVCHEGGTTNDRRLVTYMVNQDGSLQPPIYGGIACKTCGPEMKAALIEEVLKFGDFDGDKNIDVVAADVLYGGIFVQFGDGKGAFGARTSIPNGSAPFSVPLVGDFDGDGISDVLYKSVETNNESHTPVVFFGDSTRKFDRSEAVPTNIQLTSDPQPWNAYAAHDEMGVMAAGDLDGDGIDDFVHVGDDLDFGPPGPSFLRAALGGKDGVTFASNKQVEEHPEAVNADNWQEEMNGYLVLTGDFLATGRSQVLFIDFQKLSYTFLEWD